MPTLKSGDEVCRLVDSELIFGVLEYEVSQNANSANSASTRSHYSNKTNRNKVPTNNGAAGDISSQKMWKVKWTFDPCRSIQAETRESEILPTDRSLYKGCKVKMDTADGKVKVGICRSILYKADLRILGTNTIIPNVNIEEFTHLKECKQKSVVNYKGWLGVVTSVQRDVEVYHSDTVVTFDIKQILPTGALHMEAFWINEQVDVPVRLTIKHDVEKFSTMGQESSKRLSRLGFIKNLKITSVKVEWIHQIDALFPDKPRQEFKDETYKQLEVIKEDVSLDDASFNFEVGNIGRYTISSRTEFLRWDVWQRIYAKQNMPKEIFERLQSDFEYEKNLPQRYWRVYDEKAADVSEKLKPGASMVVEIAHISSIADVRWEDNTFEIPPSSLDLEILEEQIVHDTDIPRPGDFIHVKQLPYKHDEAFSVVVKVEKHPRTGCTKLSLRVLDANMPGKLIADKVLEGDLDLRISSKKIEMHPVYGYFNEATTIIVVNDSEENKLKIGNVIGTNLLGKVNVRFRNENSCGSPFKEEWIWPQACAIYSVKGYDLECVKSHVTDETETLPEVKLRRILESFNKKVYLVWKNNSKLEEDLHASLHDFIVIFSSFENFLQRQNVEQSITPEYSKLKEYLERPKGTKPYFMKGNTILTNLVVSAVESLQRKGNEILQRISERETGEDKINILDAVASCSSNGHALTEDKLVEIFSKTVVFEDSHPDGHYYAKSTKYEPMHHKTFVKTVKEELERLQKMCSTETQAEMGILVRTFASRMDLFSILMRGPDGTPYQNSLYIFDAVLPPNYPNVPPNFHFHAFRAGRLNPNLYAEGKVCVSLLGTWSGRDDREKWTKDSNIVQVLISIQGLILVKEPYHNEPGLEASKYSKQEARRCCLEYNQQLMPLVANMMLNQIEHPMDPWKNEIREFYKHQLPLFISRWKKWLGAKSENDLGPEKPEFAIYPMTTAFVKKMSCLLAKMEEKSSSLNNVL